MESGNYNNGQSDQWYNPLGKGIPAQLVLALMLFIALYFIFYSAEYLYRLFAIFNKSETKLMDFTASSSGRSYVFTQDPNLPGSKQLAVSNNERSGIEFSYGVYIFADPAGFRQDAGLLHVFHKGNSNQYPLLCPGVYMSSTTNTMRVYINTYKTWDNYCEINDIPMKKWVHVAIVVQNNAADIYINGNIAKRMPFEDTVPYQNYGNVCVFSSRNVRVSRPGAAADGKSADLLRVFGSFTGLLSNLTYFNYALSYTEIMGLVHAGPNKKMADDGNVNIPPYLIDSWWASGANGTA